MEDLKNVFFRLLNRVKIINLLALILLPASLLGQQNGLVKGKIIEEKNQQPVPYATVALYEKIGNDAELINGSITDENGVFTISPVKSGKYKLSVSSIGFKKAMREIEVNSKVVFDAGTLFMQDSTQIMDEVVIVSERMKGKSENEKTTFFMNSKIVAASGNAPDLLRHIPGIQVDLRQNISLGGNANILLFVNGKERDKSYVNQLNPSDIDRVEVIHSPPANYDGDASGVINIVLKNDREPGISGQVFTEIPTSKAIVYSFPNYRLQYGLKNITFFTSYNGEINFENIDETYNHCILGNGQAVNIDAVEMVRQKNLSHKFHYGFDYFITPRDVVNYYGSVNPYSYEQNGEVMVSVSDQENITRNYQREETDKNLNIFNSLYYKHAFKKEGSEIAFDISNYYLKANNTINYLPSGDDSTASIFNTEKPKQASTIVKVDYRTPLREKMNLSTGLKTEVKSMQNEASPGFSYREQIYAMYGTLHLAKTNYNLNLGLRTEYAKTELKADFNTAKLSFFPVFSLQYKLNARHNLLFSYRRSVTRPTVFQLNPFRRINNMMAIEKGNPALQPEFKNLVYAEHSVRFDVSFLSYRFFYERINNAINNLTLLNDSAVIETQIQNLGDIHQFGIQFLGSLKFGSLTISPSVRLYRQSTFGNNLAKQYEIQNRKNWVFDAGFSSILSLNNAVTISGTFQYSTKKFSIQENSFCDALYLLTVDKTFNNNLKVGFMAALPLAKTFVYQNTAVEATDFSTSYSGKLKLPAFPVMLRIKYQFQSGKAKAMIERDKENIPMRSKSGF